MFYRVDVVDLIDIRVRLCACQHVDGLASVLHTVYTETGSHLCFTLSTSCSFLCFTMSSQRRVRFCVSQCLHRDVFISVFHNVYLQTCSFLCFTCLLALRHIHLWFCLTTTFSQFWKQLIRSFFGFYPT